MRKILIVTLIVLMFVQISSGYAVVASVVEASNLLINGDFEENSEGWTSNNGASIRVTPGANDSIGCIKRVTGANDDLQQPVVFSPSTQYEFSINIKGESTNGANKSVQFIFIFNNKSESNDGTQSYKFLNVGNADVNWKTLSIKYTTSAGVTDKPIRIYVRAGEGGSNNTFYYDDIKIQKVVANRPTASNIRTNTMAVAGNSFGFMYDFASPTSTEGESQYKILKSDTNGGNFELLRKGKVTDTGWNLFDAQYSDIGRKLKIDITPVDMNGIEGNTISKTIQIQNRYNVSITRDENLVAGSKYNATVAYTNNLWTQTEIATALVILDSNNTIVDKEIKMVAVAGNATIPVALAVTAPSDITGCKAKVLVWEGNSSYLTTMKPLSQLNQTLAEVNSTPVELSANIGIVSSINDASNIEGRISINGDIGTEKSQNVTVVVVKTADRLNDLSNVVSTSEIITMDQILTNQNGKFDYEIFLKNKPSGWYNCYISGSGVETISNRAVYLPSKSEIDGMFVDFAAPNANIGQLLEKYIITNPILSIDIADDYPQVKEIVDNILANSGVFTKIADLQNSYYDALSVEMVKIATEQSLKAVFSKYNNRLHLDLDGDYKPLDGKFATHFKANVQNSALINPEKVLEAFNQTLALVVANDSNRENVLENIEKYNNIFSLDLSDKYTKIDKIKLRKALVGNNFKNVSSLVDFFNAQVNALYAETQIIIREPGTSAGRGSVKNTYVVPAASPPPVATPPVEPKVPAFSDISEVDWAIKSITVLADNGIVNGFDNKFRPNDPIKRPEFIKMIVSAFKINSENKKVDFKDLEKDYWANEYIAAAVEKGITKGYEDGSFGINDNLTRQDMSVLLYRVLENIIKINDDGSKQLVFKDQTEISDYAVSSVKAMQKLGIINGLGDNEFKPKTNSTRAECAVIINNTLNYIKEAEHVTK